MKKIAILLLIAIGTYGKINAQVVLSDKTGWHKIGETKADFTKERDEISVMGADRFASIKFKVTEASIQLNSLEVYYEEGDMQKVMIGSSIKAPGESRVIDLTGKERNLKKVVFVYKTVDNVKDQKAHVELWGLKTNEVKKGQNR
jgi:hypothetical protein